MSARPRVLIVDDSRVMRRAITHILAPDFDLIEREDGQAAWDALQADRVDLIISDVEMPVLDGYGLLAQVRGADQTALREMPMIFITGATDEAARVRAFEAGITDFITKPIDRSELLARVRNHVRFEQVTRELTQRIEERSQEDLDTGLWNKRGFLKRLGSELAFARRHGRELAIGRFNLGVTPASRPLGEIAGWLRTRIREEELLAHLGHGAFALLASCADQAEVDGLSARLRQALGHAERDLSAPLTRFGVLPVAAIEGDDVRELLMAVEVEMDTLIAPPPRVRTAATHTLAATPERRVMPDPPAQDRKARAADPGDIPSLADVPVALHEGGGESDRPLAAASALPVARPGEAWAPEAETSLAAMPSLAGIELSESADPSEDAGAMAALFGDPDLAAGAGADEAFTLTDLFADAGHKPPAEPAGLPPVNLADALAGLKSGNTHTLKPHLKALSLEVLPLLDLCNQELALGLHGALRLVRDKLA